MSKFRYIERSFNGTLFFKGYHTYLKSIGYREVYRDFGINNKGIKYIL